MSERTRIALVGATGLVGRAVIREASSNDQVALIGIARRETPLPEGARMEMVIAEPGYAAQQCNPMRPAPGRSRQRPIRQGEIDQQVGLFRQIIKPGQPGHLRTPVR